jgi:hypothetical protein
MVGRFIFCFVGWLCLLPISASLAQIPTTRIIRAEQIEHFPSASTIVVHHRKLYVTGDDSHSVMILDLDYNKVDSIPLFNSKSFRIPRSVKADIESSVVCGSFPRRLILLGSATSTKRKNMFAVTLRRRKVDLNVDTIDNSDLLHRIVDSVGPINIEGAALIRNKLLLAHRRGPSTPVNYIFKTNIKGVVRKSIADIKYGRVLLPDSLTSHSGISDLCYIKSLDMLLIAFTSERTSDAHRDGPIGDSFLGWINDAAKLISEPDLKLDGLINLSVKHPELKEQKIEGVCLERRSGSKLILHLVSDNDDGRSHIFKLELNLLVVEN